jgi:hypothetical protein
MATFLDEFFQLVPGRVGIVGQISVNLRSTLFECDRPMELRSVAEWLNKRTRIPVNQVQIKIVGAQFQQRFIDDRFDVLPWDSTLTKRCSNLGLIL